MKKEDDNDEQDEGWRMMKNGEKEKNDEEKEGE